MLFLAVCSLLLLLCDVGGCRCLLLLFGVAANVGLCGKWLWYFVAVRHRLRLAVVSCCCCLLACVVDCCWLLVLLLLCGSVS